MLTVSQLVSPNLQSDRQLGKQAGRQKHTMWGFFSGKLGFKQWGNLLLAGQATVER